MLGPRLHAYGPTLSFVGLLLGFLVISIGGRVGAPLFVAAIGVALIVAALIVPFAGLPSRRRRKAQPADIAPEEGTHPTSERPKNPPRAGLHAR